MARTKTRPAPAGPGLPITAAELDAMQGDARREAELERVRIMDAAVEAAGADQLPQLGGELPESERGPMPDPTSMNPDPQQAAIEKAVAAIDWPAYWAQAAGRRATP